jgi:CRISPR system Cascade subunit CasD
MNYLLFLLYGPFSSWGVPLPGLERKTDDHPTKSGVIGFLALCLGITRDRVQEYQEFASSIGFACREDNPGEELKDFHTAKAIKNNVVSNRFYLTDAVFSVCIWKKNESSYSLQEITDALYRPKFTPFLGRKCCLVGIPPCPQVIEAENLSEAFELYMLPDLLKPVLRSTTPRRVFWEDSDNSFQALEEKRRFDEPEGLRKYRSRTEFAGVIGGSNVL